ncbi:carboxymuconolactone decarboxylase family protein [Streptomyces sp. DSM 44917]|uniref:Carboxymuconolactone decarboxylase family protein n=1 Tax=Streptomyces boetiae TaxID=3075541 RepID=A0ABU2L3F8_9ACTN|nr:carboxymuconolactone decarboxylase family protein [Streptomyces sp. DSM 44917]MDT0306060.1 carboxymuconolactone decarboxylase family protein [Streptomyces sp. DSM 44917]
MSDAPLPGTASTPRIAPGGRRELGVLLWAFSRVSGRVAGTAPPALFLTLGHNRRLFKGWLRFASRLMPRGTLPRRESELIILRVAHLRSCAYEFEHHVRLGRRAGVTAADVERVVAGPQAEGWTERESTLLAAVDSLDARQDLDDAAWAALRAHLAEPQAVEFLLLVGHYQMLATTITTLRLEPDPERGGRGGGGRGGGAGVGGGPRED